MNHNNVMYLKILAIFDFILAGFTLFYAAFYAFYLVMMGVVFSDPGLFQNDYSEYSTYPGMYDQRTLTIVMGIFVAMFAMLIILILVFVVCQVLLGVFLLKKKNFYFCMIMAGVSTLIPIYGTILGSFTMIILAQPASKELFQRKTPPPLVPPAIPG
jgi:hypothetical protein